MSDGSVRIFPPIVKSVTKHLPLLPLERLIARTADQIAKDHPDFFDRLDEYAQKSFVVVPTDLDWVAALTFHNNKVQVRLSRSLDTFPNRDVTITAPFLCMLSLMDGEQDGDALFFSRDLTIEGDTEAVLALRNALDDAEIDFVAEAAKIAGPLSAPVETSTKTILNALRSSPITQGKHEPGDELDMMGDMDMPGPYPS